MSFYKYSFPYKETGSGEIRFCCPRCTDRDYHLYYNPSKGLWNCFKCGYKGRGFPEALKAIKLPPFEVAETPIRELKWNPLLYPPSSTLETVIWDYLTTRGVTQENITTFHIGWSTEKPFIVVFPIIMHGVIKAVQIRHLIKSGPKYVFYDVGKVKVKKSLLLYNYDAVVSGVDTLYVMEGILDVILGAPNCGVCTFGKSPSVDQASLIHGIPKRKLVLAYDTDVSVKELAQSIDRLGAYESVYIKQLPKGKDPADMKDEFLSLPEIPAFDWLLQNVQE